MGRARRNRAEALFNERSHLRHGWHQVRERLGNEISFKHDKSRILYEQLILIEPEDDEGYRDRRSDSPSGLVSPTRTTSELIREIW